MSYSVEYLTPNEISLLDPTGNIRNKLRMIPNEDYFAELPPFIIEGEALLEKVKHALDTLGPKHEPYVAYCKEMFSKLGRQGGAFNRALLEQKVAAYYADPTFEGAIPDTLIRGRDMLIRLFKEKMAVVGGPQLTSPKKVPTFSGVPAAIHKGQFHSETLGMNRISIQSFYPTVPGQRRMRGKDRPIFMDANPNVRAMESYLTGARNWMKGHFPEFFGSWLASSQFVDPGITKAIDRKSWFCFWDYKEMDVNFRKRLAIELIYPVYETLFPDMSLTIGAHIEQCFSEPIFWGEHLWTGLHSLLSGVAITNDFETLYTVMLVLGTAIELYGSATVLRLLVALGDDMALATHKESVARAFLEHAMETSDQVKMYIHPDKSGVSNSEVTYCRKVYYPGAKRDALGVMYGAYPSVLAVNNIVQPENPIFKESVALVADLQRLDGLIGSPDAAFVYQQYAKHAKYDFTDLGALEAVEMHDWWERLYGEKWKPESSYSLSRITQYLPKVARS